MTLVDPATGELVKVQSISVGSIRNGPEVRRKRISLDHVERLKLVVDELPPIKVRELDDGFELIDGHHRLAVHQALRLPVIPAIVTTMSEGDSWLEAIRSNIAHGLLLESSERRSVATRIIKRWPDYSDVAIAKACGLSDKTVASFRPDPPRVSTSEFPRLTPPRRSGLDGRSRPTPDAAAAQREEIREAHEAEPDASDAELARKTGASRATVKKARHLQPVPERTEEVTVGDVVGAVLPKRWDKEPACLRSDKAMEFARFMDRRRTRESDGEEPARLADGCPMELLEPAIAEAEIQATNWRRMADALRRRNPRLEGAS